MKAIHFDADGKEIQAHEVRSNVTGFISWPRLADVFRKAGELRPREAVTSFQIDDRGVTFRVE